jgi:hypothetical protein
MSATRRATASNSPNPGYGTGDALIPPSVCIVQRLPFDEGDVGLDLEENAALDIGYFVQAVADIEVALDDLLGLANSRLDVRAQVRKSFPVTQIEKIATLPNILAAINIDWAHEEIRQEVEKVIELRNMIAHGRVNSVSRSMFGYTLHVSKMSKPEKIEGAQLLKRRTYEMSFHELVNAADTLSHFYRIIKEISSALYRAGEGWPSYIVLPESAPLGVAGFLERMSFASREHRRVPR